MTCLLPTDKLIFGAGGPANGYCTFPCSGATAAAAMADGLRCQAAGGACVDFRLGATDPPQAFCMQTCVAGVPGTAAAPKCQQRFDVACTTLSSSVDGGAPLDVCIPTCSEDIDCPAGRQCDDGFAVCVDVKTPGAPLGTRCDPNATTPTCAGDCIPVAASATSTAIAAAYCSRRCVFGTLDACNWVDLPMSLATAGPHGVCVLTDGMAGDRGFCAQQCDTVNDCSDRADPGGTCDTTVPQLGHGFCSWGG